MAATTMLNLYASWDKFERHDQVDFDEDQNVSLTSVHPLPPSNVGSKSCLNENKEIVIRRPKSFCVEIKDACYTYGTGRKAVSAMKDISIKVPQGEM